EKDPLAFRVLEAFAVALEEVVGAALAPDAEQQRLLIVGADLELRGPFIEQAVSGALEKQERGPRLERGIGRQQLAIALLERREMLAFLVRQLVEHRAAAGVFGRRRGAGVE